MQLKDIHKKKIIDGRSLSSEVIEDVERSITALKSKNLYPCLAVILIGDDPASAVYVRNKKIMCEKVGIISREFNFETSITEEELLITIKELNLDTDVNGILVQFPLPDHISKQNVINQIDPNKDVDGLHPINAGNLMNNIDALVPCTPQGCMLMLNSRISNLAGKYAVVIGRSNLVGKPMAQLLVNANCTVTQVHSKTKNLQSHLKEADIIIAAIGIPTFVKGEWIKEGSTIIDVGINRVTLTEDGIEKKKLVGDVDFISAIDKVSAITPVPGGVGLMTVACLMKNTLTAAKLQNSIK